MIDYKKYEPTFCRQTKTLAANLQQNLKSLAQNPDNQNALHEVISQFHLLKGSAAMMGCRGLENFAKKAEETVQSALKNNFTIDSEEMLKMQSACKIIYQSADNFTKLTGIFAK